MKGMRPRSKSRGRLVVYSSLTCRMSSTLFFWMQLHVAGIDEVYEMDTPRERREQWLVSGRRDGVLSIMTPVFPDPENLALLLNQVIFLICDVNEPCA